MKAVGAAIRLLPDARGLPDKGNSGKIVKDAEFTVKLCLNIAKEGLL